MTDSHSSIPRESQEWMNGGDSLVSRDPERVQRTRVLIASLVLTLVTLVTYVVAYFAAEKMTNSYEENYYYGEDFSYDDYSYDDAANDGSDDVGMHYIDPSEYDPGGAGPDISSYDGSEDQFSESAQGSAGEDDYLVIDSASRNFSCELHEDWVGCSVLDRDFSEFEMEDCPDYHFSISTEAGYPELACGNRFLGTPEDPVTTLGGWESATFGNVTCTLPENGAGEMFVCEHADGSWRFWVDEGSYSLE